MNHKRQFRFLWILFQDGAAEEGQYVIANRKPTCESGTAIMVTSRNSPQFAVDGNGNVKVSYLLDTKINFFNILKRLQYGCTLHNDGVKETKLKNYIVSYIIKERK